MVYLETKTSNVDEDTKQYIDIMMKKMLSNVQAKFRELKKSVENKLTAMEEKFVNVSTVSIPEKCDEFIKDRMLIVRELEKSIQFTSEETEQLKVQVHELENDEKPADNKLGSSCIKRVSMLESSLEQATKCIEHQNKIIEKLEWSNSCLQEDMKSMVNSHENLDAKVSEINHDLFSVEDRIDDHDQYTRRNSLLIHGLKDVPRNYPEKDFIEYACQKINHLAPSDIQISPFLIDTAHVLATRRKSRNQTKVIIVKFKLRWMRNKVIEEYQNYFYKFHRGINITEHLCDQRKHLLKKCQTTLGKQNAWTEQGVVLGLINGKTRPIRSGKHLSTLLNHTSNIEKKQE